MASRVADRSGGWRSWSFVLKLQSVAIMHSGSDFRVVDLEAQIGKDPSVYEQFLPINLQWK